jgi:hypothetical protein
MNSIPDWAIVIGVVLVLWFVVWLFTPTQSTPRRRRQYNDTVVGDGYDVSSHGWFSDSAADDSCDSGSDGGDSGGDAGGDCGGGDS